MLPANIETNDSDNSGQTSIMIIQTAVLCPSTHTEENKDFFSHD